ncbi:family 20 glycosylhydrolase [Aureibaculum sp. 2210JD6-5]|uniref:glycoside hydrolase family 20 protein n=1 Tax=Aureibaculum sp. 2210JD6-5 TaxID=3103957 RepID=UPI002AAD450C|nr:family 20 glycosylhydrolase [Aureibaculum sp. 2210JD6-5]MDY7395582.1 family 20 glycosylhydrolase [Aureibaculum sp. 2210JD6-5]
MKHFLIIIFVISIFSCAESKKNKNFTDNDINIIPKPVELTLNEGSFSIDNNTKIVAHDSLKIVANVLMDKLKSSGNKVTFGETSTENSIEFALKEGLENEAYEVSINNNKVTISASSLGGFLYSTQTILQLLPAEVYSEKSVDLILPALEIKDKPRFGHRGLMLDLSRHFFPKEYILKTIDRLAMHKMNVLHLHLVDDQGWRMEIKKYPKLTEVGAWRVEQEDKHWNARDDNDPNEKGTYGGFLTQKELKEIVAYAAQNNIEVIPEIEMPAHVTSVMAAYPHLTCHGKPVAVPSGGVWPITDIYCAGKETTFEFLEDVLLEVIEVFPSKYIHIGGDEATKTEWEKCSNCKKRMKTEGLKDVHELQSYFVKRMEKFINSKGKKLIGWDEILEGGLAPEATVMSWRGFKGGIEAAEQGHDVIMTPGSHCYFDHYQGPQSVEPIAQGGYVPLNKVYKFDPVPENMPKEASQHILGAQANLWSEYIPTTSHSEYMIFPRLAALSETIWSPKASLDWNDFTKRLKIQFKRYEALNINYAKSAYLVTADMKVDLENKSVNMVLKNEFPNSDIRYVLGDEVISNDAKLYKDPIEIKETTAIKASMFEDGKPIGKIFTDTIKFHKAVAKKVNYLIPYSDSYKGIGEFTLVNALRGSKNFHDGQWQAWLEDNMEVIIELEEPTMVGKVSVGAMENQGPGIYYPTKIEVFTSNDGKNFKFVGKRERNYAKNADSELKNFIVNFEEQRTQYVKVKATNLNKTPTGGSVWLFIDEVLVE